MRYQGTSKDRNHDEIVNALRAIQLGIVDTRHVAKRAGLPGFWDLLATDLQGLTITGYFDRERLVALLEKIPGIKVIDGAIIGVEIKTETGSLEVDQKIFHSEHPALVVRSGEEAIDRLRP